MANGRLKSNNYFILVAVFLLACSCKQANFSRGKVFDIDVKAQAELSDFFESFSYVELESNDDYYIVNIDKLILDDERIYVLDERTNSVIIFDRNGKFINVIKKQGRGPHEYLYAADFEVSDSVVYILDRANEKIRSYTISGEWVKDYDLDDYYDYFKVVDNDYFYLSSGNSNHKGYNFVVYDIKAGNITSEFDKFEINYNRMPPTSSFIGGNYVSKEFDYTVYSLTPKSMKPKYTFRFNTDVSLPENVSEMSYSDLDDQFRWQPVVRYFERIYETDDIILLSYPLFNTTYALQFNIAKVDKKTGMAINHRLRETIDESFPFAGRSLLIEDGVVVSAMETVQIIRLKEMYPEIEKIQQQPIDREDEFVLFFHKIKA